VRSIVALLAGFAVVLGSSAAPASGQVPWQMAAQEGGAGDDTVSAEPLVHLRLQDGDEFPAAFPIIDELAPATVLTMRVSGFEPNTAATARQCVHEDAQRCANRVPVQFDDDGVAQFQYLVVDQPLGQVGGASCGPASARCTVVVEDDDGADRVELDTVFGGRAPPMGRIRVEPARGLVAAQEVTVTVEDFPAGAALTAVLCAAPATGGRQRCGEPGPASPLRVGPDGRGATSLTMRVGEVGTEGVVCRHGSTCGVSVTGTGAPTRARVAPVSFAAPAADYDPARVALALGAAGVLLGLAAWLTRRTDWSPPTEADTPGLDAAVYADLDAEAEAYEAAADQLVVSGAGPSPGRP
jgi:hypothetical protein